MPEASSTASVSRRCPGPSATTTEAAPIRRNAFAAATTSRGSVLIDEPAAYSTRFGLRSTERPRTSGSTSRSPSSSRSFEVAVVARLHAGRRRPSAPARETRERSNGGGGSNDAEPLRRDRAARAEPGRRHARAHEQLLPGQAHARDLRGSRSVSGPVARTAHATARGRSRKAGCVASPLEGCERAGERPSRAVEPERDDRLRERQPAGLEPPPALRGYRERRAHEAVARPLERDQRDGRRLRVAPEVDVVDRRVAEVPAAVRALPLPHELHRLVPDGGVRRRRRR